MLGDSEVIAKRLRRAAQAALAAVLLALVAPPAEAAPRKTLLTVDAPKSVAARKAFSVSGVVRPKSTRSVRLELRGSTGAWVTLAATKSAAGTGRFTLRATAPATAGATVLRVRVPKTRKARSALSPEFALTVSTTTPAGITPGQVPSSEPATPLPRPTGTPVAAPAPAPTPTRTPTPTPTPPPTPIPEPVGPPPTTANAVRAIKVLAADQTPDPATPTKIRATIEAANGWYATQTNGSVQPRWTRDSARRIWVSTVRLTRPAADYASMTSAAIKDEILAASPAPAGQLTFAWFDITATGYCGVSLGTLVLVPEAACGIHPTAPATWPWGPTYIVGHELTHMLGAAKSCAPHYGAAGHVTDDPRDVIYSGSTPRDWEHLQLDPGHDDYYATGNPACPGIAASPFWTTTSDPTS